MSRLVLKNVQIYNTNNITDIIIEDGVIIAINNTQEAGIDCQNKVLSPAFMDPHVHMREPGYEYKETVKTGSKAAAKGGYTTVFLMPNLKPVPDSSENYRKIEEIIKNDSVINCLQLGSITKDEKGLEISDMDIDAIGFSDDGVGVANSRIMYEAMMKAREKNKPIIAHCEDLPLTYKGYFNESKFTKENNLNGNLDISETAQVARDLVLAKKTKVRYHVCHISSKETLELIKYYKSQGVSVTCEVTPHHLVLNDTMLKLDGNYKMNPPVRSKEDQDALIRGIQDGSIDMIATDHAPHAKEEKTIDGPFGIVGLETAFSLLYTKLVHTKIITLEKLVDLMSLNVAKAFNLNSNEIKEGNVANLVLLDLNQEYRIDANEFLSKGHNTPFDKQIVRGKVLMTIYKGEIIWNEKN